MKCRILAILICLASAAAAQTTGSAAGSRIGFSQYSVEQDRQVLNLYDGLRVADVSDGLDMAGLQDIGLMNTDIRPLWRDTETFAHRFVGIAVTARYVPTNKRAAKMRSGEFKKWEGAWYDAAFS